ncbi:MAG: hypothetical protein KF822_12490 [Steroidobacteraceae bacterium]|nr:hypothetical protein [Steroidobacteraceae bacterium]
MRFLNTFPEQRIAAYPRAVYRVVIERAPGAALSYLTGVLRWPAVVQAVQDRSVNRAAFPLGRGDAGVLARDTVATLDYQAATDAGNATVADLANAVQGASSYARVVSVERREPVPGVGAGGVDAFNADKAEATAAARKEAAETGVLAQLAGALKVGRNVLILAVIVAAGVAAYNLVPRQGGR